MEFYLNFEKHVLLSGKACTEETGSETGEAWRKILQLQDWGHPLKRGQQRDLNSRFLHHRQACWLLSVEKKGRSMPPLLLECREQGAKDTNKNCSAWKIKLESIKRVSHEAKRFTLAQNWLVTLENEAFHLLKRFYKWDWHALGAMLFLHSLLIKSPGLYSGKIYPSTLLSNLHWLSSSKVNTWSSWGLEYQTGIIQLYKLSFLLRI